MTKIYRWCGKITLFTKIIKEKKLHQIEDDEKDNLKAEILKINKEKSILECELKLLREFIENQNNDEDRMN